MFCAACATFRADYERWLGDEPDPHGLDATVSRRADADVADLDAGQ